jgi:ubiquinone/menaquinone biosynthesis C-methylase UbiE
MEHVCPWWAVYSFDNPLRRLIHDPKKMFGPYVESGMTALDVGCGRGFNSIGLAGIVGEQGKVISVDVQQQMLNMLLKRAAKAGLEGRIQLHRCESDTLGVQDEVDFVNAFWMVHEVPDAKGFLGQIHAVLKPGGKLLVAEPKMHVSPTDFETMIKTAEEIGLIVCHRPTITFSLAAVFQAS